MYIHRSCHTRNWGEGAFAPPPTRWPREGVDPPPLILAISYSGEGQSPINPSINFRRFL